MLTCQEVVDLVTDYLERALSPDRHDEVREHLADCADCLTYLGQIQLTSRLLAVLPAAEATEAHNADLIAAYRRAADAGSSPDVRKRRRRASWA